MVDWIDERERARQLEIDLAAAEESSQLKTRFLATISHELRTPLYAILNFAGFLSKPKYGTLSESGQAIQARLIANANHLLQLINDILDMSKIEAGFMEVNLEVFDLKPLIQTVTETATAFVKDKRIELIFDSSVHLPLVSADQTCVRQILLNLLSNAVKFTERGRICITVATVSSQEVVCSVADTGIGIAAEHLERVFEEFWQVQADSSRRYQGTGLGLPICRRLVSLQGGRIWVESQFGQGCTFSFTIPAHSEEATRPQDRSHFDMQIRLENHIDLSWRRG
jgi:signal transduction histidine kinase